MGVKGVVKRQVRSREEGKGVLVSMVILLSVVFGASWHSSAIGRRPRPKALLVLLAGGLVIKSREAGLKDLWALRLHAPLARAIYRKVSRNV